MFNKMYNYEYYLGYETCKIIEKRTSKFLKIHWQYFDDCQWDSYVSVDDPSWVTKPSNQT